MVVCTVNSAYCLTITQDHPANSKDIGSITELKKETNWDYNEVEGQKEKRTKRLNLCDTIFCTGQCESVSSAILGNTWYIIRVLCRQNIASQQCWRFTSAWALGRCKF